MTKQPYPEEFKIEAVKQITERGHRVSDVSARIGVSQHSLYKWIKTYAVPAPERQLQTSQTEERDILKNVHRGVAPSQWQETRVCLH